jgi:hypothetical protein
LTQGEADDGDSRGARAIVIRGDQSPGGRRDPEPPEIVGGHVFCACELGVAPACQVEIAGALISEDGRENRVVPAEELERRVGEKPADESSARVVEAIVMPVGAVHVAVRGMPAQHHEGLRIGHRQRTQQDRIHEAEDGCVGADSQGERQDRHRAERLVGGQNAQAVAQVLQKLFPECPGPRGACVLLYESDVSQFPAGGASRFFARQTLRPALAGFLIQVELELLPKLGFLPPAPEQPPQFAKERCHCPS